MNRYLWLVCLLATLLWGCGLRKITFGAPAGTPERDEQDQAISEGVNDLLERLARRDERSSGTPSVRSFQRRGFLFQFRQARLENQTLTFYLEVTNITDAPHALNLYTLWSRLFYQTREYNANLVALADQTSPGGVTRTLEPGVTVAAELEFEGLAVDPAELMVEFLEIGCADADNRFTIVLHNLPFKEVGLN